MAEIKGNVGFLKKAYKQDKALGQKLKGYEFKLTIEGYEHLTPMVRSAQFPAIKRTPVEDKGAMGVSVPSHGALENSGEITITFIETVKGDLLKALRQIIVNGEEPKITMEATPESTAGEAPKSLIFEMEDCLLACDAIDGSTEDTAALLKPSVTVTYGWLEQE